MWDLGLALILGNESLFSLFVLAGDLPPAPVLWCSHHYALKPVVPALNGAILGQIVLKRH